MAFDLRVVVFCGFVFMLGLISSADEPVRLRVLTYNIHHGVGEDGKLDLPRLAKVIQDVKPDIVALQEVDQKVQRSGVVDQAAELGRLTKMVSIFGGNIDLQGGKYGNAVLTRLEVVEEVNSKLPNIADGEQRGVLKVMLRVPGRNSRIAVLATHFDHRRNEEERVLSAKQVNSMVEPADSAILLGDFNDVIGSKAVDLLDRKWQRVNVVPLPTVPVLKPTRQIDFILYQPQDGWKALEAKVIEESVASDHRPFFAVIELR